MRTEAAHLYSIFHKEDTVRQSADLETNDGDWCGR